MKNRLPMINNLLEKKKLCFWLVFHICRHYRALICGATSYKCIDTLKVFKRQKHVGTKKRVRMKYPSLNKYSKHKVMNRNKSSCL